MGNILPPSPTKSKHGPASKDPLFWDKGVGTQHECYAQQSFKSVSCGEHSEMDLQHCVAPNTHRHTHTH